MRSGQAAIELMVIAFLMLMVLFLLFEFGENKILESASILQVSEARNTVDRLAKAATEVHNEGVGAKREIYITIPDRVNSNRILIENNTLTVGVYMADGTTDISSRVNFNIRRGGYFPTTPGSYWVWVISKEGYVQVGSTLEISPTSVYLELFPNNSTNRSIEFINHGESPINVSLSLTWADSELAATIDDTTALSFVLPPGTSNTHVVDLDVTAYLNTSRGLHEGHVSVTTNASETESIPVIANVVNPTPTAGGVSYLTLDLFDNSAYTTSSGVFLQSEVVYYQVRSYNSSDSPVNSTILVRVYNPSSQVMDEQIYTPLQTGIYQGNYTILPNYPTGQWRITVYEVGGADTASYFTVNSEIFGSTIISLTSVVPMYPNQRAICRDGRNYVHVAWLYSSTTIRYANSHDNGATWNTNSSFYGNSSDETTTKYTPSISCDGDNITIVYNDHTQDDLIVAISTDNGATWEFKGPRTSCVDGSSGGALVERRGQNIHIVYKTDDTLDCGYGDINYFNSSDGGSTFNTASTRLWDGDYYAHFDDTNYDTPSITVNGDGGNDDLVHVAVAEDATDLISDEFTNSIFYKNSSNSGASFNANMIIESGIYAVIHYYNPSITHSGSNVYLSSDTTYSIYLNSSSDNGATWSAGTKLDNTSCYMCLERYSSTTLNSTNPIVFWQQNNGTTNSDDIQYRNYNGTGWDAIVNHTKNYMRNQYLNTKWNYAGNCIELVYVNGSASPYNITYTRFDACDSP